LCSYLAFLIISSYAHVLPSHFTQKSLTSVTESAKIMRFIVSNGKMINDGLERMWSEDVMT
jgi:hypothetical protein